MSIGAVKKENSILSKYSKVYNDEITIVTAAAKGLKAQAVFDFLALSQLSNSQAEQLLGKTLKTFNSYKEKSTVIDATVSEKLLKLLALYHDGIWLFGSVEKFNQWIQIPSIGLGGQAPLQMLTTITGIGLVTDEIIRIEHGDLA